MSMDIKVPEIRFKGFSGAWVHEKIFNIAPLQRGFDLPKSQMKAGVYPVVMSNGVNGCHYNFKAKAPGVVTGRSGTIGNIHYIETDYWPHNTALWVTNFHGNAPLFIYYLYVKLDLKKLGTGSGVPTLNRNDVHDQIIAFPREAEEQTAIGNHLKKLDSLINQHQQKHEKLSSIKKALLEKMFPKKGETIPEIRFKGFSGEWQERQFSDIATRVSTHHQNTCLPCVEYEDIVAGTGRFNKDIHQKKIFKSGLKFEIGDVLFGKLRPYLQNWFLADFEGVAVGDFWVFRAQNVASTFLFFLIQSNKFELISNLSAGSKMPRSDWGIVSSSYFFVPKNISESNKIGNYFKKIDALINQHQQQITKLNNIKQACLSKMFV